MSTNTVTAAFGTSKVVRTRALYQWDYGQVLRFAGLDLPEAYTVHFSNQGVGGEAKTMVGNADGVSIPDEYLTTGQAVYAWVYLHAGADDGETVYAVVIPVVARPKPTEDAPTPQQQGLIDQAIAALNAGVQEVQGAVEGVQDTIDTALTEAKESGEFDGDDGVSPTVDVTEITGGHQVSVTDAEGTETFDVFDGEPGADGISPTITVTDITGGHRVTVTDADGAHSFDVMDGEDYVLTQQDKADIAAMVDVPVQDVQVNGTSILSQGVANVPVAGDSVFGVAKVDSVYGIRVDSAGVLRTNRATSTQVKAGTEYSRPLVPSIQHESTFYGLAKAAGSDMASSSNPVGTYTDAAKVAIRKMLGIPNQTWELINEVTVAEDSESVLINTDQNGQPFRASKIYARMSLKPSTTGSNSNNWPRIHVIRNGTNFGDTSLSSVAINATADRYCDYIVEKIDDVMIGQNRQAIAFSSTANVNSSSNRIAGLEAITGFEMYKVSSSASLIPAGSVIRLYAIKIDD